MRLRLDIAYDGTAFRGWARQPGLRTVQGTLETALGRVLGGEPRLVVAGRTDSGVHAVGQVAHLDLDIDQEHRLSQSRAGVAASDSADDPAVVTSSDSVSLLARRVNGALGAYSDVTIRRTSFAPAGFDARFSAVWRRYEYRIADAATGYDPLERLRTTTVRQHLDEEAMDAAARTLVGLHDFAAYCKPREGATTIRTLLEYRWHRDDLGVLFAEVRADAFCHSMVRALVGACASVGEGRLGLEEVATIRDAGLRTPQVKVMAARGLTLTEVGYPADDLLATRADQTRARREARPVQDPQTGG